MRLASYTIPFNGGTGDLSITNFSGDGGWQHGVFIVRRWGKGGGVSLMNRKEGNPGRRRPYPEGCEAPKATHSFPLQINVDHVRD